MQTKIFSQNEWQNNAYIQCKNLLLAGEIVAFPTETVYGLGVDYQNDQAIDKLYELKNRPLNNPMILHVSSPRIVEELAIEIPSAFYILSSIFWPGPLTLILKKRPFLSSKISQGTTIGVRMPNHKTSLAWIEKMGGVVVGTSANLSGKSPLFSAAEVLQAFSGKIAGLVEGEEATFKRASTVFSLAETPYKLFREGPISVEMIRQALQMHK